MAFEPRHSTANVVPAADRLHDPGLPFGDLLARLLPVGVLIVDDDGSCRYASPLACAALGVTDGNALSMAWRRVATHPELARRTSLRAGDPPLQIVADLPGDVPRRLRLEVHRTEDMILTQLGVGPVFSIAHRAEVSRAYLAKQSRGSRRRHRNHKGARY